MKEPQPEYNDFTCLSQEEIESYAYLLVAGAKLPPDNGLNAYTEDHLRICDACRAKSDKAFAEAAAAFVSHAFSGGEAKRRAELLKIVTDVDCQPVVRVSILHAIESQLAGGNIEMDLDLSRNLRTAVKDQDQDVRKAATQALRISQRRNKSA